MAYIGSLQYFMSVLTNSNKGHYFIFGKLYRAVYSTEFVNSWVWPLMWWVWVHVYIECFGLQSVAKLVTHSAKFWNFLDERRTTAKKNNVCQISPRPPNQCWSLFPALWSFRVWSTLCRGEGGKFYLGLGCSKIRQKRSSVSLLLKPIVRKCHLQKYAYNCHF